MSKINATYSSGYYIAPDVDFRKLEEQQRQEQRGKRRKPGDNTADANGDDNVKRQTFAIPFDLICLHCDRRIARGSHVYTNRRATDQRYLDAIRIWELEILCRFCKGKYYLVTDPETPKETGGYICKAGCKRVEGDFFSLNQQNQAAREEWEKAKAEAELDPLAALEKENEAARQLEERNRQIEEEVEQQAGHSDTALLLMLRNRPRRAAERRTQRSDDDGDDENNKNDEGDTDGRGRERPAMEKQADDDSMGLPPPPLHDVEIRGDSDGDGGDVYDTVDHDAEDAEERSYREFAADMERRWRALERQQRAQERRAQESATTPAAVKDAEVRRVLARYGAGGSSVSQAHGGTLSMAAPASVHVSHSTSSSMSAMTGDGLNSSGGGATNASSSGSVQSSSTAVTAAAAASAPSYRNKFLVDDEDDGDDVGGSLPTAAPGARPAVQPRPLSRPALPGRGNALLRNLVDSDDDDSD